ncbi:hypothetical protein L228DRAFT_266285 [Xylona heveae TC161]|uniref:DNA2/NAM7 helicase helicase domain-containing protein n=1 Tax=Xylona heveae (strain CBS 132557 / TC161) TaxID=1328760 RepID=A0A161THU5_XYLHT|nr:hypothetical protein L228DRAFT_266285 [Xylona heveae TC161]KZF25847.1 hypothetical protein L228DRAFT_266285 [Xylona heveae TC161]
MTSADDGQLTQLFYPALCLVVGHVDTILINEAAKVAEPKIWNMLAGYYPQVVLLMGDHQQLQPTVLS